MVRGVGSLRGPRALATEPGSIRTLASPRGGFPFVVGNEYTCRPRTQPMQAARKSSFVRVFTDTPLHPCVPSRYVIVCAVVWYSLFFLARLVVLTRRVRPSQTRLAVSVTPYPGGDGVRLRWW